MTKLGPECSLEEYAEEALLQLVLDSSTIAEEAAYDSTRGGEDDLDDDEANAREIEELGIAMAASLKEKEDAAMAAVPLTEKSPREIIGQFSESQVNGNHDCVYKYLTHPSPAIRMVNISTGAQDYF